MKMGLFKKNTFIILLVLSVTFLSSCAGINSNDKQTDPDLPLSKIDTKGFVIENSAHIYDDMLRATNGIDLQPNSSDPKMQIILKLRTE